MRDGIFQAALEVIAQYGLDGLTMDRLAETAGVAKGSLYKHFPGKDELVHFVLDRVLSPVLEASAAIVNSSIGSLEKMKAVLQHWVSYFCQHRGMFELLFRDPSFRRIGADAKRSKCTSGVEIFRQIISEGIEAGVFRSVDPELAAEMLVGGTTLAMEKQLESGKSLPAEQWVDRILELCLGGLLSRDYSEKQGGNLSGQEAH